MSWGKMSPPKGLPPTLPPGAPYLGSPGDKGCPTRYIILCILHCWRIDYWDLVTLLEMTGAWPQQMYYSHIRSMVLQEGSSACPCPQHLLVIELILVF